MNTSKYALIALLSLVSYQPKTKAFIVTGTTFAVATAIVSILGYKCGRDIERAENDIKQKEKEKKKANLLLNIKANPKQEVKL